MDYRLEVVPVPVTDVDRAKHFYAEKMGFIVDLDTRVGDDVRLVQLTPPGSACSIHLNAGLPGVSPGSVQGLQLVVSDIHAARAQLVERGAPVGEVQVFDSGSFRPAREGDALDNAGFAFFEDPDGNGWALQQISARG